MARYYISYLLVVNMLLLSTLDSIAQRHVPLPYGLDAKVNYVRAWEAIAPITDASQLHTATPVEQARMTTQYLDGLGRPIQNVIRGGSLVTGSSPTDMVAPVEYDPFGREPFKYLGYASPESNGLFKLDPFGQQQAFYSGLNSPINGQGETFYYGEIKYEPSPLNRIEKTMMPGNSWVKAERGTEAKYWINTTADSVRVWNVQAVPNAFGSYTSLGTYPGGELYKNVAVDENGKQVITFTDKSGDLILKKIQLTATVDNGTGSNHNGWLSTYYIYDDLRQLKCVIQPKGVELLAANNWNITALNEDILNEQCFRYEHDGKGRLIITKAPGVAPVYMVYDIRDRLVFTQDGYLRTQGKWLATLYEALNRPVLSGLIDYTGSRIVLQDSVTKKTLASANAGSNGQTSIVEGVEVNNNPLPSGTTLYVLHQTAYDNYNNLPAGLSSSLVNNGYNAHFLNSYNTAPEYAQEIKVNSLVKEKATWTKTRILGTNDFIISVNLYDDKGRIIQVQSINQTGGIDIATTQYSFSGRILRTHVRHQKSGTNPFTLEVATKNSYDALGRIVKTEKNLNNTGWKAIAALEYDALGQVKKKKLSPDYNNGQGLENLTYDYNIRGWVLGMNRDFVKDATSSNYFGYELGYDKPNTIISGSTYAQPQYSGNIAGTIWKSKGDSEKRKYDFSYDAANRLLAANFNQYTNNAFNKDAQVDFSVRLGNGINPHTAYDANGNILAMQQKGLMLTGSSAIDQLRYTYLDNSNKLKAVIDTANDNNSQLGDFKYEAATKGAVDYNYDINGNIISDANKKITSIQYNHLNLPSLIAVAGKGTIAYTYDAAGNKLKKVVRDSTITPVKITTTLYLAGGVFENDTLQFVSHEEGRIRYKPAIGSVPASYQWDYFVKDHVSNIRMVLTEESKTDGYPAASMEDVADKHNVDDPNNYIPFYNSSDYTTNSALRYPVSNISGYPNDTYTSPNNYVSKLRGDGQKIGPAITLKVMSGDQINIRANSWYKLNGSSPTTSVNPLTELLNALTNSIVSVAGGKVTAAELTSSGILSSNATQFLNSRSGDTITKPKAYVSWILLDEQFKYISASSGFQQVGDDQAFTTHLKNNLSITKNGYLYVYVSNETPNIDVFFDNLQISHVRGPLLEETHYYPFGLAMNGISSRAITFGNPANKYKYNGYEQNTTFDINLYESFYRSHDPQLGRFWQIDPKPNELLSPYAAMANNPILLGDPLGDTTWVYGKNGNMMMTICDNLENQIHFMNFDYKGDYLGERLVGRNGDQETINSEATAYREISAAFMGSNTTADAQKIAADADSKGFELGFVGTVSSTREIRLTALSDKYRSGDREYDLTKAIDETYSKNQSSIFLAGHVHNKKHVDGLTSYGKFNGEMAKFISLGTPSLRNSSDPTRTNPDYQPLLLRYSAEAGGHTKSQTAALIISSYGITVYGTGTGYTYYDGRWFAPNKIVPEYRSYYLYKQVK